MWLTSEVALRYKWGSEAKKHLPVTVCSISNLVLVIVQKPFHCQILCDPHTSEHSLQWKRPMCWIFIFKLFEFCSTFLVYPTPTRTWASWEQRDGVAQASGAPRDSWGLITKPSWTPVPPQCSPCRALLGTRNLLPLQQPYKCTVLTPTMHVRSQATGTARDWSKCDYQVVKPGC